jgi:hypothetical protein
MKYFCDSIKQFLDAIVDLKKERYFITNCLNRGRRRLVHALSHMRRLSHMTLETTEGRRVSVSTATISCKSSSTPRKCWNERNSTWELDPKSLLMFLPSHITGDILQQAFVAMACQCQRRTAKLRTLVINMFCSQNFGPSDQLSKSWTACRANFLTQEVATARLS